MTKIDEQTLKDAVARGIPKAGGYVPPTYAPPSDDDNEEEAGDEYEEPSKSRRKRGNRPIDAYREKYMCRTEVQGRQLVAVSDEVHESLTSLVSRVAGKEATISGYVENILRHHLSEHKEMLNGEDKRKYKSPITW